MATKIPAAEASSESDIKLPDLPTIAEVEEVAQGFHDPAIFFDVVEFSLNSCRLLDSSPTIREKLKEYGGRKEYGPAFANGFMIGYLVAMDKLAEEDK